MSHIIAWVRYGALGLACGSIPLLAACGMDVGVGSSSAATTSTGGEGGSCVITTGSDVTGAGGAEMSSGSASDVGGGPFTGAGGASMGSVSSSGVGGGQFCGGLIGTACDNPDEFCDYAFDVCTTVADAGGMCRPIPEACDAVLDPVCGCDGQIYSNECEANTASVSLGSGCQVPAGQFACGPRFCDLGTSYCARTHNEGGSDLFVCAPLPASCGAVPSCACFAGVACACTGDDASGIELYCGG